MSKVMSEYETESLYENLIGACTTVDAYYESCIVATEGNQIELTA